MTVSAHGGNKSSPNHVWKSLSMPTSSLLDRVDTIVINGILFEDAMEKTALRFQSTFCATSARTISCATAVVAGGHGVDANGQMFPKDMEIDESKVSKAKYNRGCRAPDWCVFGGIERGTRKCFMVEVPDRTSQILEPLIQQYILPGTHILSDGWASYAQVDQIQGGIYTHDTIMHERHFDPQDAQIHTQDVENN